MTPLAILRRQFREIDIPSSSPIGKALHAGVYLLVDGNEVVYVGVSALLEQRLYMHRLGEQGVERKVFRSALWLPIPSVVHHHYEGALIRALTPKYNRRAPRCRGYDAEILWGLGLRDGLAAKDIATKRAA